MKYKEWLKTWLEVYVKPAVKEQTYFKYESVARVHVIPRLGEYKLQQLNEEILQTFVLSLTKKYSSNTVNGIITVIKKSLKAAVIYGATDKTRADKIQRPRTREKRVECFTVTEQKKLENAVLNGDDRSLFGVVLCLYTGLRIGELLALQWADIDLSGGLLYVNKSAYYGKDENGKYLQQIGTTKTAHSVRIIPLPKQLIPELRCLYKKRDGDFVISYTGKAVTTRAYQYKFSALLKRLNMPHRGFHSLRHTFATRALECGMDVKTLSEIMGHKSPTVTMNRYAHSMIEYKKDMMNRLGKLFK